MTPSLEIGLVEDASVFKCFIFLWQKLCRAVFSNEPNSPIFIVGRIPPASAFRHLYTYMQLLLRFVSRLTDLHQNIYYGTLYAYTPEVRRRTLGL